MKKKEIKALRFWEMIIDCPCGSFHYPHNDTIRVRFDFGQIVDYKHFLRVRKYFLRQTQQRKFIIKGEVLHLWRKDTKSLPHLFEREIWYKYK